jgi:hypothetical protein
MSKKSDQNPERKDTSFSDIFNSLKKLGDSVSGAWKEGMQEAEQEEALSAFSSSVSHGILDFDFLSLDVYKLHIQIQKESYKVFGSRVVISDEDHFMEVTTYLERNERKFQRTLRVKVFEITNVPADVAEEMQSTGKVELSFKNN